MNLTDFIRAISELSGTRAVWVEPIDGVLHVTTFVTDVTEERRASIYACERKLIAHYPDLVFDFNVRDSDPCGDAWEKFTL